MVAKFKTLIYELRCQRIGPGLRLRMHSGQKIFRGKTHEVRIHDSLEKASQG